MIMTLLGTEELMWWQNGGKLLHIPYCEVFGHSKPGRNQPYGVTEHDFLQSYVENQLARFLIRYVANIQMQIVQNAQ